MSFIIPYFLGFIIAVLNELKDSKLFLIILIVGVFLAFAHFNSVPYYE